MSETPSIRTTTGEIRLEGGFGGFTAELSAEQTAPGVDVVTLTLTAAEPTAPPQVKLVWTHPAVDVQGSWHASIGRNRGLSPDWGAPRISRVTSGAPIRCLYNLAGRNRMTFACSDALNALALSAGVREETAMFVCSVGLFAEPGPPISRYALQLRIDTRDVPYWQAVGDVSD